MVYAARSRPADGRTRERVAPDNQTGAAPEESSMRRLAAFVGCLLVLLIVASPAAQAADGDLVSTDRTVLTFNGDVTLPAGEEADVVFVGRGNALIEGKANSVVVIDGTATLRAATVQTLTIVSGTAYLEAGTTVSGEVVQLNATIHQAEGVTVGDTISLAGSLVGLAIFLGFAAILLWLGFALATLIAGFALAAFGARQVRTAEAIISSEPLKTFVVGLLMLIVPPVVLILLAISVVGLPLAIGGLLFVWPALAFVGYLVAAIWIGDWLLKAMGRTVSVERPYLAVFLGLIVTTILGIVPIVTGIISIFGLGAVTIAGWRTLSGGSRPAPSFQPTPAPSHG
jgi:hypothetical protein